MKKIIIILLAFLSFSAYGQAEFEKIAITENVATASTSKIVSQQPGTGELNYINATALPLSVDVVNALKLKSYLSTGLLKNGLVTTNADPTKFNITAGIGIISNFDNPENPTSTIVNFPAFTGITPTYLTSGNITYVAITLSGGVPVVLMQATPFDNVQRRNVIALGATIHSNLTTINLVNNISAPSNADTNQLHDLMEAIGALNISGNKYSANGANLSLNKSAGDIFKLGINFANNWKDPHKLTIDAQTLLTLRYRTQNGTEGADVTVLNPAVYDLNNVLTSVPSNRFSIQTVTLFQSGITRVQYGQNTYATMAEAEAAINTRAYVVEPNIALNGIARAYIILKNSTTSLQNASDAKIVEAQKFGGSASGGVALTNASIIAALGYTPYNDANISGTTNFIPKFTGTKTLGNSLIYENAGKIGIGTALPSDILTVQAFINRNFIVRMEGIGVKIASVNDGSTAYTPIVVDGSLLTLNVDGLEKVQINSLGTVRINSLAGTGSRLVYSDASGNLSAPDIPTAPTAAPGTNTTQIATTAFVQAADASNVKLTGNQTVNGIKNFTSDVKTNSVGAYSSDVLTLYSGGTSLLIDDTNSTITATGNIVGTAFIKTTSQPNQFLKADGSVSVGYRVYTALLTQTGTNAPTATVLENTLGTVTWSRAGTGAYLATLSGAFTTSKTFIVATLNTPSATFNGAVLRGNWSSVNECLFQTETDSGQFDGAMQNASIEIRVYN